MPFDADIGNVAHAIQLAITPVFLLTGLAALLGVMANRLARVVDRAHSIEAIWSELDGEKRKTARLEMTKLERRRHVCNWSINCCTLAALLVCLVIVTLFVEELFTTSLRWFAGCLFVAAMVLVIAGLTCFLREVYLATRMTTVDHRDRFSSDPKGKLSLPRSHRVRDQ